MDKEDLGFIFVVNETDAYDCMGLTSLASVRSPLLIGKTRFCSIVICAQIINSF